MSTSCVCSRSTLTPSLLCRSVTVTGNPDPDAPDLAPDSGVKMTVSATKLPEDFWYHSLLKTRFVPDPCEWDSEYERGVDCIEKSMKAHPGLWSRDWIREHTTRCAARPFCIHSQVKEGDVVVQAGRRHELKAKHTQHQ